MMTKQQLRDELEAEYGFPRAIYQLHIQFMEELMVEVWNSMYQVRTNRSQWWAGAIWPAPPV